MAVVSRGRIQIDGAEGADTYRGERVSRFLAKITDRFVDGLIGRTGRKTNGFQVFRAGSNSTNKLCAACLKGSE